jgi:hypothetical protein
VRAGGLADTGRSGDEKSAVDAHTVLARLLEP